MSGSNGHKRWEWMEGLTAETPAEALGRHVAKMLADELEGWPPEVDFSDEGQRARFAPLFAAGAPRPAFTAIEAGVERLKLELARDFEALDHDARNHGLEKACPAPLEQLAAQFAWTYLSESFAELFERTESRFKRRHALASLELLIARLRASWDR